MTRAERDTRDYYTERHSILSAIPADHVIINCGYTDMRKSVDGLAAMVQQVFHLDPCSRSLFLFCGRKRDRLKALYFEGDGFILLYKRLEKGCFQWPRREAEARLITQRQLRWLLEGLSIDQPKAIRETGSLIVV